MGGESDWPGTESELAAQLRKRRDRYEQLVHNMSDLLMLIDPDGTVAFSNRTADLRLSPGGYPGIGTNALRAVVESDRPAVAADALKDKSLFAGMRRADRFSRMAVMAAHAAWAGAAPEGIAPERIGVAVATALGPHARTFAFLDGVLDFGDDAVSPASDRDITAMTQDLLFESRSHARKLGERVAVGVETEKRVELV